MQTETFPGTPEAENISYQDMSLEELQAKSSEAAHDSQLIAQEWIQVVQSEGPDSDAATALHERQLAAAQKEIDINEAIEALEAAGSLETAELKQVGGEILDQSGVANPEADDNN